MRHRQGICGRKGVAQGIGTMSKIKHSIHKAVDVTRLAQETRRWIASSKGKHTIRQALAAANRTTQRLSEVRNVSREALHEPVTR
jgi:hypothetical protein